MPHWERSVAQRATRGSTGGGCPTLVLFSLSPPFAVAASRARCSSRTASRSCARRSGPVNPHRPPRAPRLFAAPLLLLQPISRRQARVSGEGAVAVSGAFFVRGARRRRARRWCLGPPAPPLSPPSGCAPAAQTIPAFSV